MTWRRLLTLLPVVVLALAAASAQASPARLAGTIVYSSDRGPNVHNPELYAVRTDGSRRRNLTRNQGAEGGFAPAPSGNRIAFWGERFGVDGVVRGLYVMRADGSGQRRLTPSEMLVESFLPTWSTDGERLAFSAQRGEVRGIWIVRSDGRDLRLLAARAGGAVWAPRGNRLAVVAEGPAGRSRIELVNADDGTRRPITDGYLDDYSPTWSPDARTLAFIRSRASGSDEGLYTVAADGGSPQRLATGGDDFLTEPAWSPREATIAFTRRTGVGRMILQTVGATGGASRTIAIGERPAWSPDGRRIAYATFSAIHVVNADGSRRRKVREEAPAMIMDGPTWSRDGKTLLFASMRGSADHELFVVGGDGSRRRQLTRNAVEDVLPAWSPGRKRLAFARDAGRTPSVWIMDATGANERRLGFGTHPSWSPDGSRIAFERNGSVFVMSDRGRNARLIAEGDHPAWAPRGMSIAFLRGTELLVADAERRTVRSLADLVCGADQGTSVASPEWSPDAARLVVPVGCDYGKVGYQLAVLVDAGGGRAGQIEIDLGVSRVAWSPDGSRIAFTRVNDYYPRIATTLLDGTARTTVTAGPADDRDLDW